MSRGPRATPLVLLACSALTLVSGCFRYQTHVPGVIDMRTDGSEADPARVKVRPLKRDDALQLVLGRGVQRLPERRIMLEDRHFWVAGNIPLANTSAADDLGPLLKRAPGWRGVLLQEEMSTVDVLAANIIPGFIPLTGWVMPPFTFTFAGEPIGELRPPDAAWSPATPIETESDDDDDSAAPPPPFELEGGER